MTQVLAGAVLALVPLGPAVLRPPALVGQDSRLAADTPQVQMRPLPTGLSFDELRWTLQSLRAVPGREQEDAGFGETSAAGVTARIDGLLVDETVTKMGQDFYSVFYGAWQAPPGAANYTLRVQEQPSRGLGTRVVVFLDGEMLFQLQLQPRYEVIEELAQRAAAYTRREVARRRPAEMPAAAGDPGGEP